MDDLITEFIEETLENLEKIDQDLVSFEINPDNPALIGQISRQMHSVKGACKFLGLSRIEKKPMPAKIS